MWFFFYVDVGEKLVTEEGYLSLAAGIDSFKNVPDIYFRV